MSETDWQRVERERREAREREDRRSKIWWGILTGIVIAAIIAGILGIKLLIAGGDWRCTFAEDPALCATVGQLR